MQFKKIKRYISMLLAVLMIVSLLPMQAFATTITVLDGRLSITDSANSISQSNGTVTVTAKGSLFSKKTNNVTIANETSDKAMLKFDYTTSSANAFTIAGASANASGSYSILLAPSETLAISIQSKSGLSGTTATLTISNISLTAASASSKITINYDEALGSVTAAGNAVSNGDAVDADLSTGIALSATAKSGVTFLGWIDQADNKILSSETSFTLSVASDTKVKAVFVGAGSAPHFGVGAITQKSQSAGLLGLGKLYYNTASVSYIFDNLNDASAAAAASANTKGVILLNSGTLPAGTHTVAAGVTLLIPFDTTYKLFTTSALHVAPPAKDTQYVAPTAYRTLTMAEGANLVVNGAVSVSAEHYRATGSKVYGGSVANSYGFINMNEGSNITVNNGGALYAYGFVSGKGTVTAHNGASVYEYFQMTDFRGGSQSTEMKNGVFPLSQYYVQNIEVPLTLYYGAVEYSYATIYMSNSDFGTSVAFIGPSNAMFNLTSGYVVKRYDGTTDRLLVEAYGDMTISPIKMDIGTSDIDSEDFVLPINSNITVTIKSGCNIYINQDVSLLPGSQIVVEKNAKCILGSKYNIYLYDADDWGGYVAPANKKFIPALYVPGRTYTRTEADLVDARVLVDGYLDVSAGAVYSTSGGANVYSTGSGSVKSKAGTQTVTYQIIQAGDVSQSQYVQIPITPAKLKNADGSYVAITSPDGVYTYANGTWSVECNHTYQIVNSGDADCENYGFVAYSCPCGHNYEEITAPALGHKEVVDQAVAPTCTATGLTEGSHCETCGLTIVAQQSVPALGHTSVKDEAVAPTCTETGLTEGSHCSVCNEVIVAQTTLDALGHVTAIDQAVAPTCTETGLTEGSHCSVCNVVLTAQQTVDVLGHAPAVDDAVAPTCTETGLTEGSHCSVCNVVLTAQQTVDALGHDIVSHEAKEPTYTEIGWHAYETCSRCDYSTYVEIPKLTLGDELKILSIYLSLDEDIDMCYRTVVPEGYTNAYMTFELDGKVTTVDTYTLDEIGRACFKFSGINPQCMGDTVVASLYATKDGEVVNAADVISYSVKDYCKQLLETTDKAENPELVALVSDLLVYGAEAQNYKNYKIDELVTDNLDINNTEFTAPAQDADKFAIAGEQSEDITWKGAGLYLGNTVSLRFTLEAADLEGAKIVVSGIDGVSEVTEIYQTPYGKYYFYVDGIDADEFDNAITVYVEKDGAQVGQSVTYSVNTYVYRAATSTEGAPAIISALYNYGQSAAAYVA